MRFTALVKPFINILSDNLYTCDWARVHKNRAETDKQNRLICAWSTMQTGKPKIAKQNKVIKTVS